MLSYDKLGENLEYLRSSKSYSREELAFITGINEKTIYNIEKSRTIPSLANLETLCEALTVSLKDIFTYSEDDNSLILKKFVEDTMLSFSIYDYKSHANLLLYLDSYKEKYGLDSYLTSLYNYLLCIKARIVTNKQKDLMGNEKDILGISENNISSKSISFLPKYSKKALIVLSLVYSQYKFFDKSIDYLTKLSESNSHAYEKIQAYINLSKINYTTENYRKSLHYACLAEDLSRQTDNIHKLPSCLLLKANSKIVLGMPHKSDITNFILLSKIIMPESFQKIVDNMNFSYYGLDKRDFFDNYNHDEELRAFL